VTSKRQTPSDSQSAAITADPGALLVLAGPGAGKTFCLIERIRFLIDKLGIDPARICAFTFTNRAAGEIETRLKEEIGSSVEQVRRGTMHAFCADLLRRYGSAAGVPPGFGIADADYQREVLCRLDPGQRSRYTKTLRLFSAHRLRKDQLSTSYLGLLERYEQYLTDRNQLDFDGIIIQAGRVLKSPHAAEIRRQWDVVLIDEFQDLNPVQYGIARELVRESAHLFAVGDDEQSVFAWNGADPRVFYHLLEDFPSARKVYLGENYRCPTQIFNVARRLVESNLSLFTDRTAQLAKRDSPFPIEAYVFESENEEAAWIVTDILRDRKENLNDLSDVAILYRTHAIGARVETELITGGVPCRLALGRAFSDDPIVGHLLAALRVIAFPADEIHRDAFFAAMLSKGLYRDLRTKAEARRAKERNTHRQDGPVSDRREWDLLRQLNEEVGVRPRSDAGRKQINRALYAWKNLEGLGTRHSSIDTLALEILSARVGAFKSILEKNHEDLSDPLSHPDVVLLAERLAEAKAASREIWIEKMGGAGIAMKGMLTLAGYANIRLGGVPSDGAQRIAARDTPTLGAPLGLFKAMQLNAAAGLADTFRDFTAIDLETTDRVAASAEIVDIAAVRVRDGRMVDEFHRRVKPYGRINAEAARLHRISEADVQDAPRFEDIWPAFREFCGDDIVIAHNGFDFDFSILTRMALPTGVPFDSTLYDALLLARDLVPTSRQLSELARKFGIDPGNAHGALDDSRTLAQVFPRLRDLQAERERKTSLGDVVDHLAIALWLDSEPNCREAEVLRHLLKRRPLYRYSHALEFYEQEQGSDASVPTADEVIEVLGGREVLVKVRTERTPDELYPATMQRLRTLLAGVPSGLLDEQIRDFLTTAALSKLNGEDTEAGRVNLLTLHATKGLEFSRVYIIGLEDSQYCCMPRGDPIPLDELAENRRLIYVGMTRAKDRLVLTRVESRGGKPTGGHQFIDELGIELTAI
jgi:DNA helicase II / ATP-dependent DNA helicase PcrA